MCCTEKRTGCKAFRWANEKCLDGPSNYCETTVVLNGFPKTDTTPLESASHSNNSTLRND